MSEDRDRILADFQACTNVEDFGHAIAVLEEHDWQLMDAVQAYIAAHEEDRVDSPVLNNERSVGTSGPTEHSLSEGVITNRLFEQSDHAFFDAAEDTNGAQAGPEVASVSYAGIYPSSSSSENVPLRMITLNVSHLDRVQTLYVMDNETIGKLKELVEQDFKIAKAEQELSGWMASSSRYINDQKTLRELNLPQEVNLVLTSSRASADVRIAQLAEERKDRERMSNLNQEYTLCIKFPEQEKTENLKFSGSRTIREVKEDVAIICGIPPRKQEWVGWPEDAGKNTTMTLATSGINFPTHHFVVRTATPPSTSEMEITQQLHSVDDSDEEWMEDYSTADEELIDSDSATKVRPLMPENVMDQTLALESFVRGFADRYGENHPVFFIGKLEDALNSAVNCKVRERRMLAVYLHHDSSVLTHVFCSRVLCHHTVIEFLTHNFIVWGWDVSSPVNRNRLLTMCSKHFGTMASDMIGNLSTDELPLLLVISRNRATNEVVRVFKGNMTVDELVPGLMHCQEVFKQRQVGDMMEEDAREAREKIKRDQEAAYMESLEADRAKAVARKMEEKEQREKEEELERQRLEEEEMKQQEVTRKENQKVQLAASLPPEPAPDCCEPIITLRLRLPEGDPVVRKFLASCRLQVLFNYMGSFGFDSQDYKLLTTFPRKDLTMENPDKSLEECKLCPQDTLTVEEK